MRSDLKIGVIVGALLVVGLVVYFMSRGGEPTEPDNIPISNNTANPEGETPAVLSGEGTMGQAQAPVQNPEQVIAPPEEAVTPPVEQVAPPEQNKTMPPEEVAPPEQQVTTPPTQQTTPPPDDVDDERKPRFYTVQEGDSLSGIAMSYYAHEKFMLVIQKANAELVKDINQLRAGWRLRIPYPDEAARIWAER